MFFGAEGLKGVEGIVEELVAVSNRFEGNPYKCILGLLLFAWNVAMLLVGCDSIFKSIPCLCYYTLLIVLYLAYVTEPSPTKKVCTGTEISFFARWMLVGVVLFLVLSVK